MSSSHDLFDSEEPTPVPVVPRTARRAGRWVSLAEARSRFRALDVVVVDTDIESSGRIFISLGQAGANVRLARGIAPGCLLIAEVRPQIVLLSTRLPDGDTAAFARRLKTTTGAAPLVVALSASDSRNERRRFLDAGCDAFVSKPIDLYLFALELARQLPLGEPSLRPAAVVNR